MGNTFRKANKHSDHAMQAQMLRAADVIRMLGLAPHSEGGHFRETFRDSLNVEGARSASTAIYFLLGARERSRWHRLDVVEIWHYYAGAPLALEIVARHGGARERLRLGPHLASGERPQGVVPAFAWQTAQSLGEWSLAGCTAAPGFDFASLEVAPEGWAPD
jgi:predicted cupin superfamily sugar epimerase